MHADFPHTTHRRSLAPLHDAASGHFDDPTQTMERVAVEERSPAVWLAGSPRPVQRRGARADPVTAIARANILPTMTDPDEARPRAQVAPPSPPGRRPALALAALLLNPDATVHAGRDPYTFPALIPRR